MQNRILTLIIYLVFPVPNRDMVNAPLDVMDDFVSCYGTLLTCEEINRGWQHFWSNCELRYREGERDPDCPPNTWRTDIQRKMPKVKSDLIFKNEQKRSTRAV